MMDENDHRGTGTGKGGKHESVASYHHYPNQCGGKSCIRGLRIRVKDILEMLAVGVSREEMLKDYPYLEAEDITAALEYVASQADHVALRVA